MSGHDVTKSNFISILNKNSGTFPLTNANKIHLFGLFLAAINNFDENFVILTYI